MKAIAWSTGSGSYVAAGRLHPLLEQLLERGAADVLHHDVAGALVGHEVVDLDDQRVLDLGQELPLGDRGGEGVGVAGVQQALEHHPAVGHVAVAGEVDPAETAVGEAAGDLVLAADQVARLQLGRERERVAALRAEALGAPGLPVAGPADRATAVGAVAALLRDHRVLQDRLGRVDGGDRRDRGQAGAEPGAAQPGRGGADAAGDLGAAGGVRAPSRGRSRRAGWTRATPSTAAARPMPAAAEPPGRVGTG